MINFLFGFVFGVMACTIGFTGMAKVADKGVGAMQEKVQEVAK
jgi:uncharacterized membrane protein